MDSDGIENGAKTKLRTSTTRKTSLSRNSPKSRHSLRVAAVGAIAAGGASSITCPNGAAPDAGQGDQVRETAMIGLAAMALAGATVPTAVRFQCGPTVVIARY